MTFRCAVLGEEERSFIVLSEAEDKIEDAMQEFVVAYEGYMHSYADSYVHVYRGIFDIPQDATMEEERELILDRFGEIPFKDPLFAKLVGEVEEVFDDLEPEMPDWEAWFIEKGFETKPLSHIIDYR